MLSIQTLQKYYQVLLDQSQRNSIEIFELNQKPSKGCPIKFTQYLIKNLEISEELAIAGLLIAKRTIDNDLKISKKILHRLIVVCISIAEKCYEEDQNMIQSYSLLSGVSIKDINLLQSKILNMIDYRILCSIEEVDKILRGDIEPLFYKEDQLPTNIINST